MNENKVKKVNLSTFLLIITIIIIIVMGVFMYNLYNQKNENENKINKLQTQLSQLNESKNNSQDSIEKKENNSSSLDEKKDDKSATGKNEKEIKFEQFDSIFYKIEDIALEWRSSTKIKNYKDFEYDLDGDSKKDKITIRGKNVTAYKDEDGSDIYNGDYVYELNGIEFAESGSFGKVYIVDLNKNDNSIEVVAWDNGNSDDSSYRIFSKRNNKMEEILNVDTYDIYTDKLGTLLISNIDNPRIYRKYYEIANGKIEEKNIDLNKIYSTEFNANGCYFTTEIENFNTYRNEIYAVEFSGASKNNLSKTKVEKLEEGLKFKVIKFNDYDSNIYDVYVQLSDGRKGYIKEFLHLQD